MFQETCSSDSSEEGGCSPFHRRIKLALYLNTFFSAILWTLAGFNLIQPTFLPLYLERQGGTPFQFSLVPIAWCLATVPSIGMSYLIQRRQGRKWAANASFLAAGAVAISAALCEQLGLAPATKIWLILGLTVLGHALMNFYLIAYLPWMGRLISPEEMGRFQSRRVLLFWIAKPLSELAAGYVLEYLPHSGFAILYAVSGLCAVIAACVMLSVPDARIAPSPRRFREELAGAVADKNLRRFLTVVLVINAAWLFSGVFPTIFMKLDLGLSYDRIGLYAFLGSVGTLAMVLGWGRVLDLFGARVVMQFSVIGMALTPLFWLLNTRGHAHFVPLAQLSAGMFNAAFGVAVLPLLYRIIPHQRQSIALALWYSVVGFVGIVSPLAGGQLVALLKPYGVSIAGYEIGSKHYLFLVQFVACVAAIPIVRRIHEPDARTFRLALHVLFHNPVRAIAGFFMVERLVPAAPATAETVETEPMLPGTTATRRDRDADPRDARWPRNKLSSTRRTAVASRRDSLS